MFSVGVPEAISDEISFKNKLDEFGNKHNQ